MFFSQTFLFVLNEGPYDMFQFSAGATGLRVVTVVIIYFIEKCLTVSPLSVIVKQKIEQTMIRDVNLLNMG